MDASELAYKAAQVMAERGHCKGEEENADGQVCFWGALKLAAGVPVNTPVVIARAGIMATVNNQACEMLQERGYMTGTIDFNDDPDVTGEDVILLLKETASRLEGK